VLQGRAVPGVRVKESTLAHSVCSGCCIDYASWWMTSSARSGCQQGYMYMTDLKADPKSGHQMAEGQKCRFSFDYLHRASNRLSNTGTGRSVCPCCLMIDGAGDAIFSRRMATRLSTSCAPDICAERPRGPTGDLLATMESRHHDYWHSVDEPGQHAEGCSRWEPAARTGRI
jgi:hypothetical protein